MCIGSKNASIDHASTGTGCIDVCLSVGRARSAFQELFSNGTVFCLQKYTVPPSKERIQNVQTKFHLLQGNFKIATVNGVINRS